MAQSRFSGSHHKSNRISCPPFYGPSPSVKIKHHTLLWGLRSPRSISPSTLPYYAWGDWLTLSILTRPRATIYHFVNTRYEGHVLAVVWVEHLEAKRLNVDARVIDNNTAVIIITDGALRRFWLSVSGHWGKPQHQSWWKHEPRPKKLFVVSSLVTSPSDLLEQKVLVLMVLVLVKNTRCLHNVV